MKSLWITMILLIYGPLSFAMTDKEMDDEAYAKFFALVVNIHELIPQADGAAKFINLSTPASLFTDSDKDLRADLVITRTYERIQAPRAASSMANPNQAPPSQLPMEDKPTEAPSIYKCPDQQCSILTQDHPTTSIINDHIDTMHKIKKDLHPQKFSTPRNLNLHKNRMHQGKLFNCSQCRFTTRYKYYLPEHMIRKHGIPQIRYCAPSNDSPSDDGCLIIDDDDGNSDNGDGDSDDDPHLSVVIGKNDSKSHLIAIKQ